MYSTGKGGSWMRIGEELGLLRSNFKRVITQLHRVLDNDLRAMSRRGFSNKLKSVSSMKYYNEIIKQLGQTSISVENSIFDVQ